LTRGSLCALVAIVAAIVTPAALGGNYVVLYKQQAVAGNAAAVVQKAGGTVVATYPQIGVLIASSDSTSFRANLLKDSSIENASATAQFGVQVKNDSGTADASGPPAGGLPNSPASDTDSLFPLQWDMQQIHTPQAHAITGGSRSVLVGDIDTGIDFTHPDLAPNIDVANSVNCLSGAPVAGLAAQDDNGHGTHTAGSIAAAANGIGIVGVAPKVRVAGIKAGDADGYFFPDAVICSFVWAGTHHMDVTNNSYFVDPFLYNCRNDPVQRGLWKAVQRAVRFAQDQGVTVVSAAGNESDDLSHPSVDFTSPDFPPGSEEDRTVTNACVVLPVELPGVIGVSATGDRQQVDGDSDLTDYVKSYYSSYGVSAIDVTAPGGDFYFGRSPRAVNGLVLSTWPNTLPCSRSVQEPPTPPGIGATTYCYLQGTSMASPHAAGLAALIISRYGDLKSPQNGKLRPGQVESIMQQTADPQPCPTELPLANGGSLNGLPYSIVTQTSGAPQECQGGPGHNSWYGSGRIDAFNAVAHITGAAANDEP
jgi:lantibiotic leader peptide-processing serine protease